MANKKISQLNAVTTLSNNDVFPVVQGTETKKAKISDIKSYLPTASSLLTGLLSNTDWVTFNNKQNALTLGNLTESTSSVLTITGGTGAIIGSGLTIQVKQASGSQNGFLSSTDWTTFNSKMSSLTLTTTGTSGAATLVGSTLNIPQYLGSAITSLGGQTGATQTFSTDTTGSDFTIASVSNNHKFSIPNASGSARGLLTSSDWTAFNNKEAAVSWGSLTETTSSILTITGGSSAVRGNVTVAVKQSSATQDGYLGKGDYSTFLAKQNAITLTTTGSSGAATLINDVLNIPQYASGITSLNALTSGTQTFATGTSGSDFNISSSTSTHTFNIPDAGASARGVVTTGTQTLAGAKTFSSAPTFSTMTAGSVLFAGTSGLLSQDNTNLFWDNTNKRLGIGTSSPTSRFHISGSSTASAGTAIGSLFNQTLVAAANNDTLIGLDINPTYTNGAFTGVSNFALRIQNAFTFGYNSGGSAEIKSLATNGAVDFLGASNNAGSFNFYGGNAYNTGSGVIVRGNSHPSGATIVFVRNNFTQSAIFTTNGNLILGTSTTDSGFRLDISGTCRHAGNTTFTDGSNLIIGTSTGTKIGTATSQKIGFWNATPIVQPTTAVTGATRVGGAGTTVTDTDTFDGYTIAQVVKALRNIGILG